MKKGIKFLLFTIALLFVTNVKALSGGSVRMTLEQVGLTDESTFPVKRIVGSNNAYVFCLDKNKAFQDFGGGLIYNPVGSIDGLNSNRIRNILFKAYSDGLGKATNVYGISETDLYLITQIAVWEASGTNDIPDKNGHYVDISRYYTWINNNQARSNAYNALVNASGQTISAGSLNTKTSKMSLTADEKYYVSDEFVINGDSNLTYSVTSSDNACVLYNNECKSTQQVKSGEKFSLRAENNNSSVEVSASITSEYYVSGIDFQLYQPSGNEFDGNKIDADLQNTVAVEPNYDRYTDSISAKADLPGNSKGNLKVSKTDATGQSELDGAEMKVYELGNNDPYDSWTSKKDVKHEIVGLIIGKIYRMEEVSSPVGFDKLTVNIYFKLLEDGTTQLCNVKNNDESTASCGGTKFVDENGVTYAEINGEVLVIKNYPSKTDINTGKVKISKKDFTSGEEIPGAHLQILDENGNVIVEWDSTNEPYEVELPVGKYILVETLPADNYKPEMIIDKNLTSRYEFEITKDGMTKIDVYNELDGKIIDTPITGINMTGMYIIGGLITLAGASIVVVAKKKENI